MSFFEELKRRNVIRVGAAYVVIAWLLAQVTELALDTFNAPDWVMQTILVVLALGLPLALFFAWAFELTPEGVKKDKDVDRSASITPKTGRKLDFTIVGILVIALGYFIWESRVADKPVSPPVAEQPDTGVEVATVTPVINERSVAVLPFANRSNLDDDLFFTDGIHDDLLTQLAKIKDLKVISRTSMMQYRGTQKTIPEIAKELGVAKILEGGVQRAGQRIRINAQLIDVIGDEHLWAETFDREMTIDNLFDIQSEITRQIVTAIKGQLTTQEQQILDDKPTNSLPAWEAYSRARELIRNSGYNPDTFRAAEPLLEQAVHLDPNFYQAQANLVEVLGLAYWIGYGQNDRVLAKAEAALRSAETAAPQSAEALAARGHFLYRFKRNYADALSAYQSALTAKPGDSELLKNVGYTQRRLGLFDDTVDALLRAFDADPGNLSTTSVTFETMLYLSQYDRLKQLLPAARVRFPEETGLGSLAVALALAMDGDVETARAIHATVAPNAALAYFSATNELAWMERDPDAVISTWQRAEVQAFAATDLAYVGQRQLELGWAYKLKGDDEKAKTWLNEGIDVLAKTDIPDRNSHAFQLSTRARILALLGDRIGAIDAARQAMLVYPLEDDLWEGPEIHLLAWHAIALAGERDEAIGNIRQLVGMSGRFSYWQLYLDPRWDFLRDDERFNELIRPANLDETGTVLHYGRSDLKW